VTKKARLGRKANEGKWKWDANSADIAGSADTAGSADNAVI
jgi:hypothetical protein